jgi:AcrR family transcriptional regulator
VSADEAIIPKVRGAEAVQAALVDVAAEMLGEFGPRSLSVRDIAERAGVNHGQVHHYFGGKRGLLVAAMRHLAKQHFEHSLELSAGEAIPPPLSFTEDRAYFRALCQSVMDGDLDLVMSVDGDDEVSVPRRVLRALRADHPDTDDLEVRASFAIFAAMQLGWSAFEELLLLIAEVGPGEDAAFRSAVKNRMQRLVDRAFD